ncbi:MAG: adenylate/guanylate cyclase domain-containing protein [Bacteroidota bacterium]
MKREKRCHAEFDQLLRIAHVIFITLLLSNLSSAQSITELEKSYKSLYGIERLEALNEITEYYLNSGESKAFKYAKQGASLADKIFTDSNPYNEPGQLRERTLAHLMLGEVLFSKNDYFDAKTSLEEALKFAEEYGQDDFAARTDSTLSKINRLIESGEIKPSLLDKTIGDLNIGQGISDTKNKLLIQNEIKQGDVNVNRGKYQAAIKHYEKAIQLMTNEGQDDRVREYQIKIASLLDSLDQRIQALEFMEGVLSEDKKQEKNISTADTSRSASLSSQQQLDLLRKDRDSLKSLAVELASKEEYEAALAYEKRYFELSLKIEADSIRIQEENRKKETEILLLKQQKRIADLSVKETEQEKQRQENAKNASLLVGLLIFISAVVIFYFYRAKKREHETLTVTYNELDATKSKLESAEKRITSLLAEQVSDEVAKELIEGSSKGIAKKSFVCVMFLDIRGFTPLAEKMAAPKLIEFQNNAFGTMIDTVEQYHGTVNQLLGDGFMATFGAPVSHGNDCQNAFNASKDIMKNLEKRISEKELPDLRIGIGLHAGTVVTGNVGGASRKQYSVTGNSVIIASRIEQLNKDFDSQLVLSEEVWKQLGRKPNKEVQFQKVKVKGRTEPIEVASFRNLEDLA